MSFFELVNLFGILVGICLHFWAGATQKIWGDELSSLFFSQSTPALELLRGTVEPIHPPLYYLILVFLYRAFPSVFFLRFFHFIVYLVTIIVLLKISKVLEFDRLLTLLTIFFWTVSAYILRFSFQLRMYGPGILFLLISILFTLKFVKEKSLKFLLISLAVDLLGLFTVYGFSFWLIIKASAIFLAYFSDKAGFPKELNKTKGIFLIEMTLSVFWLFWLTAKKPEIFSLYLTHFPITNVEEIGISFISLLGMGYFQYFEGFSGRPASLDILFGNLFAFIFLASLYLVLKNQIKKNKSFERKLFYFFVLVSPLIVIILFLLSTLKSAPLFHLRQVFPVAVFLVLALALIVNYFFKKAHTGLLIWLIFLLVFLYHDAKEYLFTDKVYGDDAGYCDECYVNFQNDRMLYIYEGDEQFGFHRCGAVSYEDIKRKCEKIPGVKTFVDIEDLLQKLTDADESLTPSGLAARLGKKKQEQLFLVRTIFGIPNLDDLKSHGIGCNNFIGNVLVCQRLEER